MKANEISEKDIVYFFNKYKYNSDQIFHLERRLLKESFDFSKWEEMLTANSQLTRSLFKENEELLNEYIRPAIKNPELLSQEAIHAFLLHVTFYLFENNIDSHVVDDLVEAIVGKCQLKKADLFEAEMNLGISKTVSVDGEFENTHEHFVRANAVFKDFSDAPNDDIRIHILFCRVFELLCYCLYKKDDYQAFINIVREIESVIRGGTPELYRKMWGENSDAQFHISLLSRYFRIYGIFLAGQCNFSVNPDDAAQVSALKEITSWLTNEYAAESMEGNINPMIFTFFHKYMFLSGKSSKQDYLGALKSCFEKIVQGEENFIYPEVPFPVDDDPVDPVFAKMLDKMKIFNWSFSFANILVPELYKKTEDVELRKSIATQLLRYYESSVYAEKGFLVDSFVLENVRTVAATLENVSDFLSFVQTIFVHREITSAIHFSMVSNLAGICLSHFIERKPELFVTEKYKTPEEVRQNRTELLKFIKNAGAIHDIGKLGRTHLINLHFRNITEREFVKISEHTSLGAKIIEGIDYLAEFRDIILGHHKLYDGKTGYPAGYDLSGSKIKVFIDLIVLCDCIDTSTDFKGRNYAKKKTFDDIFSELKSMKERYSQELVQIIDEDEALKDELRYMTSTGRNYTSYETYRQFVQPNTEFSADDVKEVVDYDESFESQLFEFYKKTFPSCEDSEIDFHIEELKDGTATKIYILKNQKNEIFGVLAGRTVGSLMTKEKSFVINDVVVRPEIRCKGWGTELLNFATTDLKQKGISHLKVNVQNDFNTESFFWIEGFSQTKTYLMDKNI